MIEYRIVVRADADRPVFVSRRGGLYIRAAAEQYTLFNGDEDAINTYLARVEKHIPDAMAYLSVQQRFITRWRDVITCEAA